MSYNELYDFLINNFAREPFSKKAIEFLCNKKYLKVRFGDEGIMHPLSYCSVWVDGYEFVFKYSSTCVEKIECHLC